MNKKKNKLLALFTTSFLSGALLTGCSAGENTCQDFLDSMGDNCNAAAASAYPDNTCDGAKKKDVEYFECLRDWADMGCSSVPTCSP